MKAQQTKARSTGIIRTENERRFGRWLHTPAPRPAPRLRLVCFPHAGAGSSLYHMWSRPVPEDIEVCAVQLPGRETRFREPPARRMEAVVEAVGESVASRLDVPLAIYGHSMGALLAFELARWLRREKLRQPVLLLLSGSPAPDRARSWGTLIHRLPEKEFQEAARDIVGVQPELLDDPATREYLLPLLRADLELVETYDCRAEPPLTVPVTAFYGTGDLLSTGEEAGRWADHTEGPFRCVPWPGGHFYPVEDWKTFLALLLQEVMDATEQGTVV
ncbi:alpha/beta fold hydrolase [Streptomyces sp. NPDC048611]|uniref:thioesterase II family protein n=1 Tax=Streptomyces sp. NPDC048611 TaxID=3155635 RepID=UPI00344978C5